MNCLQTKYPVSVENPRAGTFSGTLQALSDYHKTSKLRTLPAGQVPQNVSRQGKQMVGQSKPQHTENERKEELLDKFFALTQKMLHVRALEYMGYLAYG